jgi:flagellar basal body-associated protein FliL
MVFPSQAGKESQTKYEPTHPRGRSSWPVIVAVILTVIFVIYGIIYYVMNSEPYTLSESFIRQNQTIREEIGEVDKCDPWFPIEMYPIGREENAMFTFDVIGKSIQTTEVTVYLQKRQNRWRIISAYYKDRQGLTKPLLEESRSSAEKSSGHPVTVQK